MRKYLTRLIEEKGVSLDDEIEIEGHYGLTWSVLVDFIVEHKTFHDPIRTKLTMIDYKNGDVFHFLNHLAVGMIKSWGYEV